MYKKTVVFAAFTFILFSVIASAQSAREFLPQTELFKRALAQSDLTPGDVRIDFEDMSLWGGDKYRVSLLDVFFADPWKISPYTRSLTDGLLKSDGDISALTVSAHKRLDSGVRLGLIGDPLEAYRKRVEELRGKNLAVALAELTSHPEAEFKTVEYRNLPDPVRDAAALILFAAPDVLHYRELALVEPINRLKLNPDTVYRTVLDYVIVEWEEEEEEDEGLETMLLIESLLDNTDWTLLNTGATLIALAAQEARRMLTETDTTLFAQDFDFRVNTQLGYIVLSGASDGYYSSDDHLLIIDTAGGEAYASCAANRSFDSPVSVCIDLGGDDTYRNEDATSPAFGAGVFGYSVLIDCAGDDSYETPYIGEGCGVFGTGVLWDISGDDSYSGFRSMQGCGTFGTGILADNAGNDSYELYEYGQGYGYTMGCGYLVDSSGDDTYRGLEEPAELSNGGPFGEERFIHFAQGAAFGRRADFTDGHGWAGGVGILVDGAGDDRYECQVYGQGTGYWYGIGMCVDKGGDDYHHAGWYSLGSSPHFAIGILQDDAGDDRYVLKQMQSIGNGRDFSIGWFEDGAGDDWYQGGIMCFGTGDVNGLGFFWDRSGNDVYMAQAPCFGQSRMSSAGSLRDFMLTLGLFVDGGGTDTYLRLPGDGRPHGGYADIIPDITGLETFENVGNGECWARATQGNEVPGSHGSGVDAE